MGGSLMLRWGWWVNGPLGHRVGISSRDKDMCASPPGMHFLTLSAAAGGADGKGWEVGVGEQPPSRTFRLLEQICPLRQKVPRGQDVTPGPTGTPGFARLPGSLGQPHPFPGRRYLGLFTGRVPALSTCLVLILLG